MLSFKNSVGKYLKKGWLKTPMEKEEMEMEIIRRKIEFYNSMNLKCHIKLKPMGFVNGKIISSIVEDGQYFIFQDIKPFAPRRIFLYEIFDIKDYEEVGG